jgi:hypothetical protein
MVTVTQKRSKMGKWILIGLAVLVIGILFLSKTNLDPSGHGSASATNTANQTNLPPPMTGNTGGQIGTPSSGTTLTGHQCRVTCRGKCGGINPPIAITKAQKSRKLCHQNCRASICNYISESEFNS